MKRLNPIQVAAAAVGAVLSALIASVFGVAGTVIGVAVGSVVATTVTALVWESIERTHNKVREVVVSADHLPLLHRGATGASGRVVDAAAGSSAIEASVDAGSGEDDLSEETVATPTPGWAAGVKVAGEPGAGPSPATDEVGEMRLVAWSRVSRTTPTPRIARRSAAVSGGRWSRPWPPSSCSRSGW